MSDKFKVGILYSTTGPYGAMGRDGRDGAEFALEEVRSIHGHSIEAVLIDPHAKLEAYLEGARTMLRDEGCRHIVGTLISLTRQEVVPIVEKYDALLWYMVPYEGFEANENVVYIGGCPNQHLLPTFDYLIPRFGNRPYLIGANYVWGWEMNRIAREFIIDAGGEVLGEHYMELEDTDVDELVRNIELRRPSFILNNLVGPSSFAFHAKIRALGERDEAFRPDKCPVVSCDLTECELPDIGKGVATGQLAAAAYFDGIASAENQNFKERVGKRFGSERRISSVFACAYVSAKLCAEAIIATGTDDPRTVRRYLSAAPRSTVLGQIQIDPHTHHADLPLHIGRINEDSGFDIIASQPAIHADPYLIHRSRRNPKQTRAMS